MSTVGRNIGMGPIHYQKTGIIKCEEKIIKACETDSQCCSVVACEYCLEWDEYGEELVYGLAVTDESGNLSGEVAGFQFRAEWERTGYSDDCSLMVYVDDQIRGSIPLCANFITCRDVSAWVTVTDKDEYGNVIRDGVLRWDRRELRELPYRKDENRCTQKFCGNCDCTCRELCVTITDPEGAVTRGELPDISYSDCEGPLWSGVAGEYEIAVELGRDADNDSCILNVVSNGEDGGWVEVVDCKTLSATWTLYDGTTIEVVCKVCDCEIAIPIPCYTCCLPMRFDIPEYPSGLMTDAPFSITGCTINNNGAPTIFTPRGATVVCPEGQSELVYDTGYWIQPVVILYPIDEPDIFGDCPSTPCGSIISFYLECTGRYLESEDLEDTPCNRIWLWAGASGSRQLVGGVYDDWPGNGTYANPDVATKWLRIAPSSCVCSGGAEGAALIFPLELAFDNPDATVGANGDCAGRTIGACIWSCSGTLTI